MLEWWYLSLRRYVVVTCIHLSRMNYNEALEAFLILLMNYKTLDIQKPNPRRWNARVMWAQMGMLVPQLPGVVTFSYDLIFRHVIARWKCIFERYTLHHQNMTPSTVWLRGAKKTLLRSQNGRRSTTRCAHMKKYKIIQLD